MITVAIGDIHGMYDMLEQLLSEIDTFTAQEIQGPLQLIFLGDYIDRGPDSSKVVRRLRMIEGPSVICLRGNHEQMMVECEEEPELWRDNGGAQTKRAYKGRDDQFEDDKVWMSHLPTSFEDELRIFVHAGIKPGQPLADQTDHTKLWIRGGFLHFTGAFPKYVVHGHTPTSLEGVSDGAPIVTENRCNIDTEAVFGGRLTAAFFNNEQAKPFHMIGVDGQGEVRRGLPSR
jgi:serine/threonine protein phosphatase 1